MWRRERQGFRIRARYRTPARSAHPFAENGNDLFGNVLWKQLPAAPEPACETPHPCRPIDVGNHSAKEGEVAVALVVEVVYLLRCTVKFQVASV